MATGVNTQVETETSTIGEGFIRNRDLYLFLPFILGFSGPNNTHQDSQESNEDNGDGDASLRERIILVNPFTQGMIVLEDSNGFNPLLRSLLESHEVSQPPASKASIDAMPIVEINGEGGECVICLEECVTGDKMREMPCKHRFHGGCIEKWLGIHGSCPVCRYVMPVDEDESVKKLNDRREIWVRFSFNDGRRVRDSNQETEEHTNGSFDSVD